MNISDVKTGILLLGDFILNNNFGNLSLKDENKYGSLILFKMNEGAKNIFKNDKINLKGKISCIYFLCKDDEIIKIGQSGDSGYITHYAHRGFTGKPNKSRFNSHLQIYKELKKNPNNKIKLFAIFQSLQKGSYFS